jgi:hypothetical protein
MILRGFGEEFLDAENRVFGFLRANIGPFTAITFFCLIIIFAANESLLDFRSNEINSHLPLWVRQEIGIQSDDIQPLSDLSTQLGFLTGISTLAGIVVIVVRRKRQTERINVPNSKSTNRE